MSMVTINGNICLCVLMKAVGFISFCQYQFSLLFTFACYIAIFEA